MPRYRLCFLLLLAAALTGCTLPDYYTPGGYSSTARKRLMEASPNHSADNPPTKYPPLAF